LLNSLGIYHFGQIAAWTPAEMRWIGQYLAFPERIERDDWIGQAIVLASGADTGFEKAADRRRRRRQEKQQAERQLRQAEQALFGGAIEPEPEAPPEPPPELDEPEDGEENQLGAALQHALERAAAAGRAAERRVDPDAPADGNGGDDDDDEVR
jgi:hypothetical protein